MEAEKKYHQRKLAIIEMIEKCDRCIDREMTSINNFGYACAMENSRLNIKRYKRIKNYLLTRYNN